MMTYLRYSYLFLRMVLRNIRWAAILLLAGDSRPWRVLDFRMILSARKAGWDPKENSIHKQLILDRQREPRATEAMQRFIEPDDVILELGANIGYYVLMESRILSNHGYIYAIEPSPDNIALLEKNVVMNGVRNIEIFNLAMSDRRGMARLFMGPACNLHSLVERRDRPDQESVEVRTESVDNFLKDKKPITFLRMDVEGYETIIFDGMPETLASTSLKKMFIEIHPMVIEPDRMQAFFRTLQEHGFEIETAVSRDNWQRNVLGECKVEHMTIAELACDERILSRRHAFEIFFRCVR